MIAETAATTFNPAWLLLIIPALAVLAGAFKKKGKDKPKTPGAQLDTAWLIGPEVNGNNRSENMPKHPTREGAGWFFDLGLGQRVNALVLRTLLRGKKQVSIRFRVDGAFQAGAQVCLMFQRRGDDWSAAGPMNYFRWYSRKRVTLTPGEHELTALLTRDDFKYIQEPKEGEPVLTPAQLDAAFKAALDDTASFALGFGAPGGAAHGASANPTARFTLHNLTIN